MLKFNKFQRPTDFDPKLGLVQRELSNIEERLHLLDIRTDDPEALQSTHDHCMVSNNFWGFGHMYLILCPQISTVVLMIVLMNCFFNYLTFYIHEITSFSYLWISRNVNTVLINLYLLTGNSAMNF